MSATTTLILIIENLITKVQDDDGALNATLAALKTEVQNDEAAETALAARVTTLEQATPPAPVDLTPLTDAVTALTTRVTTLESNPPAAPDLTVLTGRVQALEDRNAADDTAAGNIGLIPTGAGGSGGSPATLALSGLPATGTVGDVVNETVVVSGGTSPFQFSILSGALPDGLVLGSGGRISGTLTTAGDFTFSLQAHDANNIQGVAAYDVIVAEPLAPAQAGDSTAATPVPQEVG